jgi:hypothetical protein
MDSGEQSRSPIESYGAALESARRQQAEIAACRINDPAPKLASLQAKAALIAAVMG